METLSNSPGNKISLLHLSLDQRKYFLLFTNFSQIRLQKSLWHFPFRTRSLNDHVRLAERKEKKNSSFLGLINHVWSSVGHICTCGFVEFRENRNTVFSLLEVLIYKRQICCQEFIAKSANDAEQIGFAVNLSQKNMMQNFSQAALRERRALFLSLYKNRR